MDYQIIPLEIKRAVIICSRGLRVIRRIGRGLIAYGQRAKVSEVRDVPQPVVRDASAAEVERLKLVQLPKPAARGAEHCRRENERPQAELKPAASSLRRISFGRLGLHGCIIRDRGQRDQEKGGGNRGGEPIQTLSAIAFVRSLRVSNGD